MGTPEALSLFSLTILTISKHYAPFADDFLLSYIFILFYSVAKILMSDNVEDATCNSWSKDWRVVVMADTLSQYEITFEISTKRWTRAVICHMKRTTHDERFMERITPDLQRRNHECNKVYIQNVIKMYLKSHPKANLIHTFLLTRYIYRLVTYSPSLGNLVHIDQEVKKMIKKIFHLHAITITIKIT